MKKILSVSIDQNISAPEQSLLERFWRQGQKLSSHQVSHLNLNGIFFREGLYLKQEQAILVVLEDNTEVVFQGPELRS